MNACFMVAVSLIGPRSTTAVSANTCLQVVAAALKRADDRADLAAIGRIVRRAEADGAEHFLDLALRERVAVREFLAQRLRAVAAAIRAVRRPSRAACSGPQAPVVVPVVVRRDVAGLEVVRVDQVLRLHLARRVDQPALRLVEVVVGEGLRHRVHAAVAADAVVEEHAAVAARAARHVLTNAIRRTRRVVHLLHVAAHVVQHREAEHRAVRAVDEERFGRRARRDDAGGRRGRQAVQRRLRGVDCSTARRSALLLSSAS